MVRYYPDNDEKTADCETWDLLREQGRHRCQCDKCLIEYLEATGEWEGHHAPEQVEWVTDRLFRIKWEDSNK